MPNRLATVAYTLLALAAFSFPVSIAASGIALFPLLALYFLGAFWTFKLWPPRWGKIETLFAIFWAISLVSAATGEDPWHSRVRLEKDLYVVLIVFLGAWIPRNIEKVEPLMRFFLWGGLLTAAFAILQFSIGINKLESTSALTNVPAFLSTAPTVLLNKLSLIGGRANGLRGHPLTFGETLLFPLAYTLSLLATATGRPWRRAAVAQCILMLGLLFSQSRGPWLAFVTMAAVLCLLEPPRVQLIKRIWAVLLFPVVLVVCVPSFYHRVMSIGDTQLGSNAERLVMWKAGLRVVKDHPLLGVGPGNIKLISMRYQTPEQHAAYGDWGHLHNTYINFAAERGLLGLIAFLILIGLMGTLFLKTHRALLREPDNSRVLVLTAFLSLIGWMVCGMTEATYNDTSILMMFYFVMGIGLAYCRTWREWRR